MGNSEFNAGWGGGGGDAIVKINTWGGGGEGRSTCTLF